MRNLTVFYWANSIMIFHRKVDLIYSYNGTELDVIDKLQTARGVISTRGGMKKITMLVISAHIS